MNTCNIFWTYKEIIIGCLVKTKKQFFKGVVHEQPCSSIVCLLWRSSIVSNFCLEHFIFHNPALLSFSFPLLKRFSFYFLSSILLDISICLISISQKSLISCVHTHTWGRSMVFHLVVCSMGYWPWCYSWTICNHFLANAVHGVTACDMGLLLGTWGYCLWKVQKTQFWSDLKVFWLSFGNTKNIVFRNNMCF